MKSSVDRHCREIDRCNQRGGRMLSVVDLMQAGTMGEELAAYSLAAIGQGASFMIGALPGGAGKTTAMGALLNFVPPEVELAVAEGMAGIKEGQGGGKTRRCYICHEISPADYYSYLWDDVIRAYFELPLAGHMLATNLHADTYEQAADQLCRDNSLAEGAFWRMNLIYFLTLERKGGQTHRRVGQVWESDGSGPHRLVYDGGKLGESALVSAAELAKAKHGIDAVKSCGGCTIDDVRAAVVGFLAGH